MCSSAIRSRCAHIASVSAAPPSSFFALLLLLLLPLPAPQKARQLAKMCLTSAAKAEVVGLMPVRRRVTTVPRSIGSFTFLLYPGGGRCSGG